MKKRQRILDWFFGGGAREMSRGERAILHLLHHYGEAIMGKIRDVPAQLDALTTTVNKVRAEIQILKDESQNTDTTPEFDASLQRLQEAISGADQDNPDQVAGGETDGGETPTP